MSKVVKMVAMALVLTVILTLGAAGAVFADDTGRGPAPNSHDGIPDGPGWTEPWIPNGPNNEQGQNQNRLGHQFVFYVMEVAKNNDIDSRGQFYIQ